MRITINKIIEYCEKAEKIACNCREFYASKDEKISIRYSGEVFVYSEIVNMLKNTEHFKAMYDIVCKDE